MLSIVIPAYERPHCLKPVLDALHAFGPHMALQIIVVNDGGTHLTSITDRYADVIYCYLDPPTSQHRAGMARNFGASIATGERILFLDSDCIPSPHCLSVHATYGADNKVVAGRIDYIESKGGLWEAVAIDRRFKLYGTSFGSRELQPKTTGQWKAFWGGNMSVPAQEFKAIGGFWEEIKDYGSEDQELAWRMQENGSELWLDFRALAKHIGYSEHEQTTVARRRNIIERSQREKSLIRQGRFLPTPLAS